MRTSNNVVDHTHTHKHTELGAMFSLGTPFAHLWLPMNVDTKHGERSIKIASKYCSIECNLCRGKSKWKENEF